MTPTTRPILADLDSYQPGKPAETLMRERGLSSVVKLASNEGPWGPFPAAREAIEIHTRGLNRYPDAAQAELRERLARLHGVDRTQVIAGSGADGILSYLAMTLLEPGRNIVCAWPSFQSYVLTARRMGAEARTVPLSNDDRHDLDAMLEQIDADTRIVYVCNPNNPTGTMVARDALAAFVDAVPEHVLVVIDEAYFDYVRHGDYPDAITELFPAHADRVLVLRTFSKIYGLAGLRVGYAVAPAAMVRAMDIIRNPFDVSSLALAAADASIRERALLAERVETNLTGRRALHADLLRLGQRPIPSVANFVCVRLNADAGQVYEALLDRGVIVRPLVAFGMSDAIRITVGLPDEQARCIAALEEILAGTPDPGIRR